VTGKVFICTPVVVYMGYCNEEEEEKEESRVNKIIILVFLVN